MRKRPRLETKSDNLSQARHDAENQFERRERLDSEIRTYQQKRWDAETAKIARLKALRLARDADASIETSENTRAPGEKTQQTPRKRMVRPSKYLGGYE